MITLFNVCTNMVHAGVHELDSFLMRFQWPITFTKETA